MFYHLPDVGPTFIRKLYGEMDVTLFRDYRQGSDWLAVGKEENRGGGCEGGACCSADGAVAGTLGRNAAGRGEGPFEKLSTCLALIDRHSLGV